MHNTSLPVRIGVAAAALSFALFPIFGGEFYVQLVTKIMIMAIFAMSLDLLVGYTGLVSLGHAAFFGVAGYALALASPQYEAGSLWLTLAIALGCSGLLAALIGALVLRTSGIYFIMATLAFAQMLFYFFHDAKFSGGSDGLFLMLAPEARVFGLQLFDVGNKLHFYYFVGALLIAVYGLLRIVLESSFGHALRGIKGNEQRMRSLGFSVYYYKLAAFVLAGTLAGLAGYLAALQFGFVNPELLGWHHSGNVLMMVILGGMGSLVGPVIGAFSMVLLQEVLSSLTKHWQLVMGLFIIVVALFLPHGIGGLVRGWTARAKTGESKHG